jgi:hypothetical protein
MRWNRKEKKIRKNRSIENKRKKRNKKSQEIKRNDCNEDRNSVHYGKAFVNGDN